MLVTVFTSSMVDVESLATTNWQNSLYISEIEASYGLGISSEWSCFMGLCVLRRSRWSSRAAIKICQCYFCVGHIDFVPNYDDWMWLPNKKPVCHAYRPFAKRTVPVPRWCDEAKTDSRYPWYTAWICVIIISSYLTHAYKLFAMMSTMIFYSDASMKLT